MRAMAMGGLAFVLAAGPAMARQRDSATTNTVYWVDAQRYEGPTVVLLEPAAERSAERLETTRGVATLFGYAVATDDPHGATQIFLSAERWIALPQGLRRGYLILDPGLPPRIVPHLLSAEGLAALLGPVAAPPPKSSERRA